jgi:glucose-6-phosphate 1-dehydrogenase
MLIDNWRWAGVPFYMRVGKRLEKKVSEIAIVFKRIPYSIFPSLSAENFSPNVLVLNVQPDEGISLTIRSKKPGPKLCMGTLTLDFKYRHVFGVDPPEAYERLLLDCMLGDQTLFIREDCSELAWSLITPVLEAWQKGEKEQVGDLYGYKAGSWGPEEAEGLIARDGRKWRIPGAPLGEE